MMQFKTFSINITGDTLGEEELNKFLRSHRIITVHRELARTAAGTYWCFCVEYIDNGSPPSLPQRSTGKNRIDYKDVLNENEFAVFAKLRDLRKTLAEQDGVPMYVVCTNEHLAAMVQNKCRTKADLQKINGFGEAKIDKYGKQFLEVLANE